MKHTAQILLLIIPLLISSCQPENDTPNIVFILIDDLGWYDLAGHGNPWFETPNIDALSQKGTSFSQAYSSPLCTPTRAALMTGKYPGRLGMTRVGNDFDRGKADKPDRYHPVNRQKPGDLWDELSVKVCVDLPLEETTLGELAKEAGYHTGFIGKWHLGFDEYYPDHQGFDWVFGGDHWSDYFAPWAGERTASYDAETGQYITDRLASEAVGFIERNKDEKFFLCLWNYGIHAPTEGKPDLVSHYDAKITDQDTFHPVYASMVHSIDQCVGRVVNCLEDNGLTGKTLIVFMSDNGPLTGTVTDRIYDPRFILNRHTANDVLFLGGRDKSVEQEFTCREDEFLLGFRLANPENQRISEVNGMMPWDLPDKKGPVMNVAVLGTSDPGQKLAGAVFTAGQLNPEQWIYIRVEKPDPSDTYLVRFTAEPAEEERVIPLEITFDNSLPGSEIMTGGTARDGDIYLKCVPGREPPKYYSTLTSSGPFRGRKIQVYEGGIRVPLYFVWPGVIAGGQEVSIPVAHIDMLPTLAAFMKQEYDHPVDGVDLYDLIMDGESLDARELYWHYPHYMYANGAEVVRDDRFKYIEFYSDGRKELYDLLEDPGETENLITQNPGKADELRMKLYEWLDRIDARMPDRAKNSH